ncbi:MAG: VOC family protein [Acidimicrobiales bacterium]
MSPWRASVHHIHLISNDFDPSLEFHRRWFDAVVLADFVYAGARNVVMGVGSSRLHLHGRPPRVLGAPALPDPTQKHIRLRVARLERLAREMTDAGIMLVRGVQRFFDGSYLTVEAPEGVVLELFEPRATPWSPCTQPWFDLDGSNRRLQSVPDSPASSRAAPGWRLRPAS